MLHQISSTSASKKAPLRKGNKSALPPEEARSGYSQDLEFGQLELQPTALHQAFPFLLVLDVSPNLLGIEPNRIAQ